jgi:XTP/dITP diphosphohydrolase
MCHTLYVASSNPGKLRDFTQAAGGHGVQIVSLPGLDRIEAPPEDALTFEENALEKAIYYSRFLPGEMVLSDDSGLEVDFLHGSPGVRSARYAADFGFQAAKATDENNNLYLLHELNSAGENQRAARYHCVLAVAQDGTCIMTAQGTVEGRILTAPRGEGGFGYDPLFYIPALSLTMAELDPQTRWAHSHRGEAFRALLHLLKP